MNVLHANDRAGEHAPSWYAATATPPGPYPALKGAHRADVCVIGGGYTGLSAALHLAEQGMDVILVEAQRVGFGASGRNGGQVGSGQRQEQDVLERWMGRDDARALWGVGEAAKTLIADLIARHDIDCAYRPGVVHAECHARDVPHNHGYARKLAADYGYDRVEVLDRDAMRALVGSPLYHGGSVDWGAGHLHPLRLAFGLARAAENAGARLFERSEVHHIQHGDRVELRTGQGQVQADHLVLAVNGYMTGLDRDQAARIAPINNFIVATKPLADPGAILARDVAVADSKYVVNYFRLSEDGRLLFGGGESYGMRFPRDIAATVRKPMEQVFPQLAGVGIDHAWGGTLGITTKRLPHFSHPSPNVWAAGGYSGHGVALATLAGRILAKAVAGQAGQFDLMARLPCPRFPGGPVFRSPLAILAMSWFALRDRLGV
ncbi:NAD(P)/FAD-dependent oxidoreductase [Actibacterium ureilyticum]|uniref:NAD(P)/FAD-dependent oxidoreductase n=1 Tax=Actibacterium ureilyticum TaxID=1590614 RepID=UPI000BAAFF44|nr:FAD-binding oxidoreductase [Actibacterium ureilyticum]